jgi:nitrite reductase/ring-hydroxylating ferredoxin subunit
MSEHAGRESSGSAVTEAIDLERVICRLSDLEPIGARGFTIGEGDWPLRGIVVRVREEVRGYLNRCPHAGHPLNLRPNRFLTADGALLLCASHGALFDKLTGLCIAGPCPGQWLQAIALKVADGFVMLADGVDPAAMADTER